MLLHSREEIKPEAEDLQPYKPDLMQYLPPYYQNSAIMKAIHDAYSEEFGYIYFFLEDFVRQFLTPATATWGLAFWEQELDLPTDISKTYEERREIILSRLQGMGITGKDVLKKAAAAFSGGDVEVIEYPAEHRFVVKFVGTLGVPKHIDSFMKMVDDIRPAHLSYSFEYTYRTYGELSVYTHAQLSAYTHQQLREEAI